MVVMYLYCGECGREMTATITEINSDYIEIAYYCEACKKTRAFAKMFYEKSEEI